MIAAKTNLGETKAIAKITIRILTEDTNVSRESSVVRRKIVQSVHTTSKRTSSEIRVTTTKATLIEALKILADQILTDRKAIRTQGAIVLKARVPKDREVTRYA